MTGNNPQEVEVLIDGVQKAFLIEIVDKEGNLRQKRLNQLKKLSGEYETQLKMKRDTLKQIATTLGSRDRTLLARRLEWQKKLLDILENELLEVHLQRRKVEVKLMVAQLPDPEAAERPAARDAAKTERARYQQELKFLKAWEKALNEDVDRRAQEVFASQANKVDVRWLEEEITQVEQVARRAAAQLQILQVELDAPARVTLLEPASVTKE
jgi:hypothetical protein